MSVVDVPRGFRALNLLALLLCFCVVVFGAFVRLSDAGLSCPDWPTCYGKAAWPVDGEDIVRANSAFPEREVEPAKVWREQFHRHLAAILGVLILIMAWLANRHLRLNRWLVVTSVPLLILAIMLYSPPSALGWSKSPLLALSLAGLVELALLMSAIRAKAGSLARLTLLALALVIFQALLGKWTVTLLVKPIIVVGHLLGGMSVLALLGFLWWRTQSLPSEHFRRVRSAHIAVVFAIVGAQIALGGWVSSNYAALACPDFPTCQGKWLPASDFAEAFVPWRGLGIDYEGGVLDGPARTAIHLSHRWFALIAALAMLWLAIKLWREIAGRAWSVLLLMMLSVQLGLGIANVTLGLPLAVASAHQAGAALIVLLLTYLLWRTRAPHFALSWQSSSTR
jgi:cytochrome c oxidase assembly protein subunit 15